MATVAGGASWATYWTAKRYIYPLIAPPTPPQLEQDKASIDAAFDKTFALLEQLSADTKELKDSEQERKERLDKALGEVESVIGKMKEANENRESEAKRMAKEMEEIRDSIPQAIQKEKDAMDSRVKDLAVEMKSLKTLVGNRMGQSQNQRPLPASHGSQTPTTNGVNGTSSPVATPGAESNGPNGTSSAPSETNDKPATPASSTSSLFNDKPAQGNPYSSRMLSGKAAIPSWQLAAKKRSEEAAAKKEDESSQTPSQNISESGTAAEAQEAGV